MLCLAAEILYRVVSGARFLTGGVIECNIADRRSVAELLMLSKIICASTRRTLFMVLFLGSMCQYGTRGALAAHRYIYSPPRCRSSQFRRTCITLSVSLWNDLAFPVFDGVGLAGFNIVANVFLLA